MKPTFFILSMLLIPLMSFAEKSERFSSSGAKLIIHEMKQRQQQLTFVPEEPGKETGFWRIVWGGGGQIAELLIPGGIALPDFKDRMRIEMDLECEEGTALIAADLRLQDSAGEICALNSRRGNRYTGKITAVWEFDKEQNFKMAWGKNVNHKLDLPGKITNFAFRIQGQKGEITLKELRITADPLPSK